MDVITSNRTERNNEQQHRFYPYAHNGGTVLGLAGDDFALLAADTRLSEGFSIHTRDCPKTIKLTNETVLGSAGFHGDVLTLRKVVNARLKIYEHTHNKTMSTSAISAMLSTLLYYRRFFPYYVSNMVAGMDDEGKGCIYHFDPVGSYERDEYYAGGTAGAILQPLLDNQIGYKHQEGISKVPLTKDKAVALVKDVFISAAERDIYTGDSLSINIITREGVEVENFPLRRD